jgi:cold-inducible RNA-binding protein
VAGSVRFTLGVVGIIELPAALILPLQPPICESPSDRAEGSFKVKKLYIGNLPFQASEEDLQALFSEAGVKTETITLIRDRFSGQPRGFGFVEVADDGEADKAISTLNGKDFKGRAMVVNEARPPRDGGAGRGGRGGGGGGGGRGGHGGGGGRGGGGGGRRDY